jgi:hypothetical protein
VAGDAQKRPGPEEAYVRGDVGRRPLETLDPGLSIDTRPVCPPMCLGINDAADELDDEEVQ